ncbi:MAG: SMC-Scp complex subunit ScpB [Pirellulales bacterium]
MQHDRHTARELGLEEFTTQPSDEGLSLAELKEAYVAALEAGEDPYPSDAESDPTGPDSSAGTGQSSRGEVAGQHGTVTAPADEDQLADEAPPSSAPPPPPVEVNPRSILEAMLFVGGMPVVADQAASLMRGVSPAEVEDLVYDLNREYRRQGRPYTIVADSDGYRLALNRGWGRVVERLYGSPVREVRLSHAAIEVLALVAYRQPITRQEVEALRGAASGAILRQLVRRELLCLSRGQSGSRDVYYHTTQRFLHVFGLESLDELPRPKDIERL